MIQDATNLGTGSTHHTNSPLFYLKYYYSIWINLDCILHSGQLFFNNGDYNASLLTTYIEIEYLINKLGREKVEEQTRNLNANALKNTFS